MPTPLAPLSRRDFLRSSAGGFALGSLLSFGGDLRAAQEETRDRTFVEERDTDMHGKPLKDKNGKQVKKKVNHTLAIASLGGATMDNEWNYVQAKLMRALGVVYIENQARI